MEVLETKKNERNNNQPLVSIVIPVYNGANYMREAIDSALAQTYKNIEIIVVNDGSTDNGATESIALSYGDKIRYFYKENGGVSTALNLGIKNMKGEYFSWLSHDDKYTKNKIAMQVEALICSQKPYLVALCADRQIDKNSEFLRSKKVINDFSDKAVNSWDKVLMYVLGKGTFYGCSFLIPKAVFEKCGLFDEQLRYRQDFVMWIKMFLFGCEVFYDVNVGVHSRIHNQQVTQLRRDLFYGDTKKITQEIIPLLISKKEKANNFLFSYAKRSAIWGNREVVKACKNAVKEVGGFSFGQKVSLFIANIYGGMRPLIRKVYYKVFKKVKTQ